MTPQTPRILEGDAPTVAMNSIDEFTIRTNGTQAERIEALYRTGSADVVHAAGGEMFEAMKISRKRTRSSTSQRMARLSALAVRSAPPPDRAADQVGRRARDRVRRRRRLGYHVNQGGATGQLAQRLDDFSNRSRRWSRTSATVWPTSRSSRCRNSGARRARTATAAPTTATRRRCS